LVNTAVRYLSIDPAAPPIPTNSSCFNIIGTK
jgi:hypothetical protein